MQKKKTIKTIDENQLLRRLENRILKNIQKSKDVKILVLSYENKILRGSELNSKEFTDYQEAQSTLSALEDKCSLLQQNYYQQTGEYFSEDTSDSEESGTDFPESPLRKAIGL